ncbi:MAG: hypothetical protein V1835_01465 [Candidatus Micrarchaeota archaeon]
MGLPRPLLFALAFIVLLTPICTAADVNPLQVTKINYEPRVISADSVIKIIGETDSKTALTQTLCFVPKEDANTNWAKNAAACSCTPSYDGKVWGFTCEIAPQPPKVLGSRYAIQLQNKDGKSTLYLISFPQNTRVRVLGVFEVQKKNLLYLYFGIFAGFLIISISTLWLFRHFEDSKAIKIEDSASKR